MKKYIHFIIFFALLCGSSVYAFDMNSAGLSDVKIDKQDVEAMMDKLVEQGQFTREQVEKAKQELSQMDDQQMKNLTGKAIKHIEKKSAEGANSLDGYLEGISD